MAIRFRKVAVRIWNDQKFRELSDRGKLAFLFVLTHPNMTGLGAMRATTAGLAGEIGWLPKTFREALGESFREGLIEYDEKACFLALPNFLKYNKPETPNVVKSWPQQLDLIPECGLKIRLISRVSEASESFPKGFAEALPKPFRKALAKGTAQEQEQEQDSIKSKPPTPLKPKTAKSPKPPKAATVPPELDTPDFHRWWADWIAPKRGESNRKAPSLVAQQRQLAHLARMGVSDAIASIEQSLRQDWQGLFDPKDGKHERNGKRPSGSYDAAHLKTLAEILSDPKLRERYTEPLRGWRCLASGDKGAAYGVLVRMVGVRYADCSFANYQVYEEACEGRLSQRQVFDAVCDFAVNMDDHVARGGGLVLYGRPGTGKDHLLLASAYMAIFKWAWAVAWVDGLNLYMQARERIDTEASERLFIKQYTEAPVLIISDPIPPKGDATAFNTDVLHRIIDRRYRDLRSTWASINVHDGTEAEARLASPIVDRLRHDSVALECKWRTYRASATDAAADSVERPKPGRKIPAIRTRQTKP